jgi:hypothetical protein
MTANGIVSDDQLDPLIIGITCNADAGSDQ